MTNQPKWYCTLLVVQCISGLCCGRIIENESFLRTPRPSSSVNLSTSETVGNIVHKVVQANVTDFKNSYQFPVWYHRNTNISSHSKIIERVNAINSTGTISTKSSRRLNKMQRRVDIGYSEIPKKQPFFFAMTPQTGGTTQSTQESLYYINYRQAYGIRFEPNKIRRSFNIESAASDNINTIAESSTENVVTELASTITTIDPEVQEVTTVSLIDSALNDEVDLGGTTQLPVPGPDDLAESTTALPVQAEENSHIMSPSLVNSAIEIINNRFSNVFTHGFNLNGVSKDRFLNIFKVIKFKNVPCSSQKAPLTSLNGTCYNQNECDELGGVVVDVCAGGFGVCCVFQYGCGGLTQQSISYFKSPNFPAAHTNRLSCKMTIQLLPNVKSVLVEFIFFEFLPPIEGSCSDDQFIITGQNINSPVPIFCGINSGQHIYLDVEDVVERQINLTALTSSVAPRAFNIRLSQLLERVAPQGCLQYYTDTVGFVQTFNYEDAAEIVQLRNPSYFNNLNYAICIRRAPDYCVIAYSNQIGSLDFEFQLTNVDQDGTSVIPPGQAGAEIFNCADDFIAVNGIRLCGERLNDASITEDYTVNAPVSDYSSGPIVLPVRTNADTVGRGFKLFYEQQPCSM